MTRDRFLMLSLPAVLLLIGYAVGTALNYLAPDVARHTNLTYMVLAVIVVVLGLIAGIATLGITELNEPSLYLVWNGTLLAIGGALFALVCAGIGGIIASPLAALVGFVALGSTYLATALYYDVPANQW